MTIIKHHYKHENCERRSSPAKLLVIRKKSVVTKTSKTIYNDKVRETSREEARNPIKRG